MRSLFLPSKRALACASLLVLTAVAAGCVAEAPEDVECEAAKDGNLITWSPAENATSYGVYRRVGDQDFEMIANVTDTEYLDTNVTDGVAYRYYVTSFYPANFTTESVTEYGESEPSRFCDITAIPFFPALGVAAVAVIGGVLAFVVMRRRKG